MVGGLRVLSGVELCYVMYEVISEFWVFRTVVSDSSDLKMISIVTDHLSLDCVCFILCVVVCVCVCVTARITTAKIMSISPWYT
jgi:hypothetical protein